ncbi:MAG TPA: prolipoprotein diacylglyceryl transferase [Clostridiales bacterium]|jgi:phosphatidylglycerol:prolipoprotein diacylglycerol transferase|nr:prolipoprotein diacylglyceryl transferase [Clostridiales bacterium]
MSDAIISFPLLGENFKLNPSSSYTLFGREFNWYGAIIALGFLLAALYVSRRAKLFGLTVDNIIDMLIISVPIAIVGARLYYVVFNFSQYKDSLVDIVKIWEGGLAIYGGVIGGIIGVLIFSRVKKIPMAPVLDVGSLGMLIGQAVGRWGNFINREAFGKMTDVPWKMGLTTASGTYYFHPTFLYESLWNLIGLAILHYYTKKRRFDGEIFLLYVAWYGLGRFWIEGLRTDSLYLFSTGIRVSQLLAGVSFLAALALLIVNRYAKRRRPGSMFVSSGARGGKIANVEQEPSEPKDE